VGILNLRVVKARGLMVSDRLSGKSDPYVRIALERQKEQTKKIKKNLNPVWDADFSLYVPLRLLLSHAQALFTCASHHHDGARTHALIHAFSPL
jgi:Ca2+-dependent lipid-binding protein